MNAGPGSVAALGAVLLAIGVYGSLARRHAIGALIALQIAMLASTVTLVGVSRLTSAAPHRLGGDALALVAAVTAAAQGLVGVALAVLAHRRAGTDVIDGEDD